MIDDYKTVSNPYEGHYRHYDIKVSSKQVEIEFRKGDVLVPLNQWRNRYIVETLEPEAPDSFFAWNFFDGILMQKEYFSSYVFEELALELLEKDPDLREAFETARAADPEMQENARAQLNWIYKHSPYYESTHQLYPVGRVIR